MSQTQTLGSPTSNDMWHYYYNRVEKAKKNTAPQSLP